MKLITIIIFFIMLTACSFQSEDEESIKGNIDQVEAYKDSDGDLIIDEEEIKVGKNPLIADLPNLKVRFLQNYKIDTVYKNLETGAVGSFEINTKVRDSDPDFKYRVGKIFVRDNSYKVAAGVGKFKSHTWGEIEEHDLSWIKYPDVDSKFFHEQSLLNRKYFEEEKFEIDTISITLENSVKLMANRGFKQIRNLEINFYYYNYEKENYELLKTKKILRHFNTGVNETFEVIIENIPSSLLKDNYFKKGEFIISEIKDYEIPEMGTTYQNLLASVKSKTISVVYNSPLESSVDYIASGKTGKRFGEVLEVLYPKKVKIEEDSLIKINQFENNLPDFTYLKEIEKEDKKGQWYVLTNRLDRHYLDHEFTSKDIIVLSYINGSELASQTEEEIYSYRKTIDGGNSIVSYSIGNVTPNSEINIQIMPHKRNGTRITVGNFSIDDPGGNCGRNCNRRGLLCRWDAHIVTPYSELISIPTDFSREIGNIELLVNNSSFLLKDLISKGLIEYKFIMFDNRRGVHLKINDINKIVNIFSYDENVLAIKLKTEVFESLVGIRLYEVGRYWRGSGPHSIASCAYFTPLIALGEFNSYTVSNESLDIATIKRMVPMLKPNHGNKMKFRSKETFKNSYKLNLSSSITNFHN